MWRITQGSMDMTSWTGQVSTCITGEMSNTHGIILEHSMNNYSFTAGPELEVGQDVKNMAANMIYDESNNTQYSYVCECYCWH